MILSYWVSVTFQGRFLLKLQVRWVCVKVHPPPGWDVFQNPVVNNGIFPTNLNWWVCRISGCHQRRPCLCLVRLVVAAASAAWNNRMGAAAVRRPRGAWNWKVGLLRNCSCKSRTAKINLHVPHGQSTWHSPQKVGLYMADINQYKVTVPSTFTLV